MLGYGAAGDAQTHVCARRRCWSPTSRCTLKHRQGQCAGVGHGAGQRQARGRGRGAPSPDATASSNSAQRQDRRARAAALIPQALARPGVPQGRRVPVCQRAAGGRLQLRAFRLERGHRAMALRRGDLGRDAVTCKHPQRSSTAACCGPGQVVSMKHIARSRNSARVRRCPQLGDLPDQAGTIRHTDAGTEFYAAGERGVRRALRRSAQWASARIRARSAAPTNSCCPAASAAEMVQRRVPRGGFPPAGVHGQRAGRARPQTGGADARCRWSLGLSFINGGAAKDAEVEVSVHVAAALAGPTRALRAPSASNVDLGSDEERAAFGKMDGRTARRKSWCSTSQALKLDQAPGRAS